PIVKTKLMKTPCFYADEATKWGTEHHGVMGFHNMGITRMSMVFGSRNELNTAIQPVIFKDQSSSSLLVTYDVGRPFILNPKTLELGTPIGKCADWMTAQPPMVPWPFGIVQTTAHPVFDPLTKELYTVNYTRNKGSFTQMEHTIHHLRTNRGLFKKLLESLAEELVDHPDIMHVKTKIKEFQKKLPFLHPHTEDAGKKHEVFMYLLRYDGPGPLKRWEVEDQTGEKLVIDECMHQMGISEDFIILTDCSFKFGIDLLFDNPFPESKVIERLIRRLTSGTMDPNTLTYIIKRADLKDDKVKVTAYKLKNPIPYETIHYSCDYANPDGVITLYGIHNAATCVAEWVRTFDKRATDHQPVEKDYISLFAVGSMDVSRLGKWKIDTKSLDIDTEASAVFESPGNYHEKEIGPNTWTLGLYAYKDILSSTKVVPKIEQMWFISAGLHDNLLTEFIWDLYQHYPHRKISLDLIKELTKKELPVCIQRIDLNTMKVEDVYQCPEGTVSRGVHFIPRKTRNPLIPESMDGYIFAPFLYRYTGDDGKWEYSSEFWIFDAININKGPICKMKNDHIIFAFSLHTAWMEEAIDNPFESDFTIRDDYSEVISKIPIKKDREFLNEFFEKNIYSHFS
uniref:carotenoid oxygenase family protein n=1 Tax=Aquiflexum sp. TaxID=1872584 RepID=UPI0035936177